MVKLVATLSGREPTFLLGAAQRAGAARSCGWCALSGGGSVQRGPAEQVEGMELDRIKDAAERVAHSLGLEVVDVEWKVGRDRFLRVYIDKPEGVSHKDCEAVSNQLSVMLDVEDLVPGPQHYILEVSSPGLDRKLTKPAEFERFTGRLAQISAIEPAENQKCFDG